MAPHRFAAFWAAVLVVAGLSLVASGVLLAAAVVVLDLPFGHLMDGARLDRVLVGVGVVVAAVLAGAPLIGLGELVRLSIAQRRVLERQRRLLERIARRREAARDRPAAPGAAAADRLLQRRP